MDFVSLLILIQYSLASAPKFMTRFILLETSS